MLKVAKDPDLGIQSKTIWINGRSAKGNLKSEFSEVFARYLPRSEAEEFVVELLRETLLAKAARAAAEKKAEENSAVGTANIAQAGAAPAPSSK